MQVPSRIHYRGMRPSDAHERVVREAIQHWLREPAPVAYCAVGVERWHQHHGQGTSYRVVIDVTRSDGTEVHAASDFEQPSVESAMNKAVQFASRRLAIHDSMASANHAQLSDEARRLLPLHGWLPG